MTKACPHCGATIQGGKCDNTLCGGANQYQESDGHSIEAKGSRKRLVAVVITLIVGLVQSLKKSRKSRLLASLFLLFVAATTFAALWYLIILKPAIEHREVATAIHELNGLVFYREKHDVRKHANWVYAKPDYPESIGFLASYFNADLHHRVLFVSLCEEHPLYKHPHEPPTDAQIIEMIPLIHKLRFVKTFVSDSPPIQIEAWKYKVQETTLEKLRTEFPDLRIEIVR